MFEKVLAITILLFGLVISVLGLELGKTWQDWWRIIKKAYRISHKSKTFDQVLVLEMGADKKGDIQELMDIVAPDIGIVTNVENVHLQNYASKDELAYEKSTLIRKLNESGYGFVNYDNAYTKKMATRPQVQTFGLHHKADIVASEVQYDVLGLKTVIKTSEHMASIHAPHILGKHNIYAILAAYGVARHLGVPLKNIQQAFKSFRLPDEECLS